MCGICVCGVSVCVCVYCVVCVLCCVCMSVCVLCVCLSVCVCGGDCGGGGAVVTHWVGEGKKKRSRELIKIDNGSFNVTKARQRKIYDNSKTQERPSEEMKPWFNELL